ncbi:PREDICTED: 50S ribosomal protein L13, chloroplastic-like isoform X2 [Populus euphratica]|uniref:50S ribosomal protein L13, chloroplastic-like isoform X2 n=1 Tax=Populus euphratica TaxID=75702 RepID=A0AAJ6X2B8_POPEU|nr:PREDICTED: 50S ribosomal protein L13, chloroplastic-like isoform X2 [Populus euphratica]
MAMLCASSSFTSTKPSCSYSARNGTSICTTPFVAGFSFSQSKLKPCVKTSLFPLNKGSRSFEVRCEKKEKNVVTRVPLDQRWLFEESELNGPDIWNTTWYPKAADHINTEKTWYVVDATDKILGRLASTIAIYIRGKNLATYTPSVDMGAFVIVVNAEKVAVSGKKRTQKLYRRHSGRPGGMKVETFDQLQQRIPERIIEHAVRGMLPKGRVSAYVPTKDVLSSYPLSCTEFFSHSQ